MKDRRQSRMVCTDESPAPLTVGLVLARIATLGLFLLVVVPIWMAWIPQYLLAPAWLLLFVSSLMSGVRVWSGPSKRWRIRMDRRGLTEIFRLARSEHYPWDTVKGVDLCSQSAVVHTSLGDIDVGPEVEGGRALAVLVKLRLEQGERAPVTAAVEHERVAAWLGVAPGEVVSVRIRDETTEVLFRLACAAAFILAMLLTGLVHRLRGPQDPVLWLMCLLFGVPSSYSERICSRRLDATAERLRMHCPLGKYDLAWWDLLSIRYNGQLERPCWVVQTLRGRFTLHKDMPGAGWLAKAIEQAVSARRAGAELPRMSEVSDAAISPVTVSTSPDRGLSPAEGNPPDAP